MFNRHDERRFQVEAETVSRARPYDTGGQWYVTDEQYLAAVQRGMRLRSQVAAELVRGFGRWLAGLPRRLFGHRAAAHRG